MKKHVFLIAAGLCGLVATSHANPVAWYKFDEGAGATTAINSVVGGTNGAVSLTGVTTGVAGVAGNAYQFTKASNGFVDMGSANFFSSINLTGQLTISTWINTNSTLASGNRNIAVFAGNDTASNSWVDIGYSGPPDADGQAYGRNRPSGTNITELFTDPGVGDDQWHHVALTLDVSGETGTMSLYFDGVLIDAASMVGVFNAFPIFNNFEVGRLGRSSPTDYYGGLIDDVQVYDTVLSAGDIQFLFNNPGVAVPEPSAMALAGLGLGVLYVASRRKRRA